MKTFMVVCIALCLLVSSLCVVPGKQARNLLSLPKRGVNTDLASHLKRRSKRGWWGIRCHWRLVFAYRYGRWGMYWVYTCYGK